MANNNDTITRSTSNSFVVYSAWGELFQELTDAAAGKLMKALFEYVRTGNEPGFKRGSGLSVAFAAIRNQLDINIDKYAQRCEVNRRNAIKGARKKGKSADEDTNVSEVQRPQATAGDGEPNDNDNDNDNYNDNYDDNENDNDTAGSRELGLTEEQYRELTAMSSVVSVGTYISKLMEWQEKNKRKCRDPYSTIKRWITQDSSKVRESETRSAEIEDYERFAMNYVLPEL